MGDPLATAVCARRAGARFPIPGRCLPAHHPPKEWSLRQTRGDSQVFAGEIVGIREVDDQVWLVSFLDFDLGFFDRDEGRVEPAVNPFGPEKVSTMSPE
jgi:hypothetical protein